MRPKQSLLKILQYTLSDPAGSASHQFVPESEHTFLRVFMTQVPIIMLPSTLPMASRHSNVFLTVDLVWLPDDQYSPPERRQVGHSECNKQPSIGLIVRE